MGRRGAGPGCHILFHAAEGMTTSTCQHENIEIIVVDDDPNDAELITRIFTKNDLAGKFIIIENGSDALSFLLGRVQYSHRKNMENPRVILLDLKMPKVNGLELLHSLRAEERTKNVPIVIFTSSKEDRDLEEAYNGGANSYVVKPIKFDEYEKVVANLGLYWLSMNKTTK